MAATVCFSNSHTFLSSLPSSSSSSSSPATSKSPKHIIVKKRTDLCKAIASDEATPPSYPVFTKRGLYIKLTTTFLLSADCFDSSAAILEADDDEELLEKVKKDRKKRLERQGVISSSNQETAFLQDLVYKLSRVGQAIENNDLSAAGSVLGQSSDADWVQKVNAAFAKLSSSPEEKFEVDTFNSSLAYLISSVVRNDMEASKTAFVSSATAFEKWTSLTGLVGQLKGL